MLDIFLQYVRMILCLGKNRGVAVAGNRQPGHTAIPPFFLSTLQSFFLSINLVAVNLLSLIDVITLQLLDALRNHHWDKQERIFAIDILWTSWQSGKTDFARQARQGEPVTGTLGLSFQLQVVSQLVCLTAPKTWGAERNGDSNGKRQGIGRPGTGYNLKADRRPLYRMFLFF